MRITHQSEYDHWIYTYNLQCAYCDTTFMCEDRNDFSVDTPTTVTVTCPKCHRRQQWRRPEEKSKEKTFAKEFDDLFTSADKVFSKFEFK